MAVSIKMDGVDFLIQEMNKYGPEVSRKAADQGTRAAARMLARHLRNEAPRGETGTLKKSIGFKYYPKTGWAKVGLRRTRGKKGSGVPYYYKTLEFGRRPHTRKGSAVAGTPPLRPFFEKTATRLFPQISRFMLEKTQEAVYDEARKVWQRNLTRQSRTVTGRRGR